MIKPSYKNEYGEGIDMPINAFCYELTNGGDLVRGQRHKWRALILKVQAQAKRYRDTNHLAKDEIERKVRAWLDNNERKYVGIVEPMFIQVRDHECSCGHKWTAPVALSKWTSNLSGEERPSCPECHNRDGQFVMSGPIREV
jgi:hypothetical protein